MTLVKCRECGNQISDEAVSCPHCGVPNPAAQSTHRAKRRVEKRPSDGAGGCLSIGLLIAGGIWTLIGAGNIIVGLNNIASRGGGQGMMGANLMINMLLFVFPGLVVAGIGGILRKR